MHIGTIAAIAASLTLLASPAFADPEPAPGSQDLTQTVNKAMEQASAVSDAVREDANGASARLSQAPSQAIYARYRGAGGAKPPGKPCDHPEVTEAGGLCIPPASRR